jgi:hypothetical protein
MQTNEDTNGDTVPTEGIIAILTAERDAAITRCGELEVALSGLCVTSERSDDDDDYPGRKQQRCALCDATAYHGDTFHHADDCLLSATAGKDVTK